MARPDREVLAALQQRDAARQEEMPGDQQEAIELTERLARASKELASFAAEESGSAHRGPPSARRLNRLRTIVDEAEAAVAESRQPLSGP